MTKDVQEPVAVVDANDEGYWADILPDRSVKVGQLLYPAAQRQWVGLTDKQMVDAIEPLYLNRSTAEMAAKISMDEFRAIEAKLKEKNGGSKTYD
jgi:hypothetical protein